jgi:hypothetical protein
VRRVFAGVFGLPEIGMLSVVCLVYVCSITTANGVMDVVGGGFKVRRELGEINK